MLPIGSIIYLKANKKNKLSIAKGKVSKIPERGIFMLPIGSIVYLKEGTSKLMVLNRGPIIETDGEQKMFDYSGCFYPQGLDPENVFYFNQENIDEVVFEGFQDEEEERFQKVYNNWIEENKDDIKKGAVTAPLQEN